MRSRLSGLQGLLKPKIAGSNPAERTILEIKLKHIKHWRVIGELTEDELYWLYINKFDVEVERDEIHLTEFGDRLMLFFERWEDEFHGCRIEF